MRQYRSMTAPLKLARSNVDINTLAEGASGKFAAGRGKWETGHV
jgi:hypothetical protein